jgi:hypothetical protein
MLMHLLRRGEEAFRKEACRWRSCDNSATDLSVVLRVKFSLLQSGVFTLTVLHVANEVHLTAPLKG